MASIINRKEEVLLSICIPTFNRATQLDGTLKSITEQFIFTNTNKIELVISDNCSTDETLSVVERYKLKYPGKIIYSRNDFDLVDKNFEKVLSLGSGTYLKLNNDTLKHHNLSLEKMVYLIESNSIEKPVLFFSNGTLNISNQLIGNGASFLITKASFYTTWIATFGIWKVDFNNISNFNKASYLKLIQADILFDLCKNKRNIIIDDEILFNPEIVSKKGGYDIVTVFLDNYSKLLDQLVQSNDITINIYKNEMDNVINKFLALWLSRSLVDPSNYNFILNSSFSRINIFYNFNLFKLTKFYIYILNYSFREIVAKCIKFKK